jgi:hypothetical protein
MEVKLPSATIVLANLMSSEGELNVETKARIDLAVKLHCKLPSDVILLCGWAYRPDCSIAIADAMKSYILAQFPGFAEKIVCQKLSRDTVGDAVFARICLGELFMGISSFNLNVVTSDYHAKRVQEIFSFVFGKCSSITVAGAPGFSDKRSAAKEIRSLEAFRNTFFDASAGDLNSIYLSLMKNHPFYNGFIHPRIEARSATSLDIRRSLASS